MAGLFIKLDCDYWDHPRIVRAGVMAGVLYQRMSMYCMQHTTDGIVPAAQLPRFALPATGKLTAALVDAGLIEPHPDGWLVPGYVERYPSAAELEQRRLTSVENGRKGGRPRNPEKTQGVSGQVPSGLCDTKPSGKQEVEVDVDVEVEPPPPEVTPVPASADPAVVAVADSLIAQLGYADPPPAGPDIRGYVARAIGRGWTASQLADLATEAGAREDVADPLGWLRGALKNRANQDPPAPATVSGAAGPALDTWSAQWSLLTTRGPAGGANEAAKAAWFDTRKIRKFDTETNAKFAFRDAYLARSAAVPAEASA